MNALIGLLIIIIDQIIKTIIITNIPIGTTIGKGIRVTNVTNTGMAYSMRSKQTNDCNYCKYCSHMYANTFPNKKLQDNRQISKNITNNGN